MSLSSSEVSAIQSHWNASVKGNLQAAGNALLHAYLTAHPSDQALFKTFSSVPLSSLCSNTAFNTQTLVVATYLDKVVDALGGSAGALLKAKVPGHAALGVTVDHVQTLLGMVGGVLADNLGANAATVAAWNKAAGALASEMRG